MGDRNKIILLDDRFQKTGEPTVQPVVLWGLHGKPLYEPLSKEASNSPALEYIQSVQPTPGRTVVLILGLGSFEAYGLNRNGDGFNEYAYNIGKEPTCGCCHLDRGRDAWVTADECLQNHYKTYEQGHVYRHHCFPAGTPIILGNRTRIPIETITEEQLVATHEGPQPVTSIFQRHYEGPGVRLRLRGEPNWLTGTAEHPVALLRREQVHCRHKYNRLTDTNHKEHCKEYQEPIEQPVEAPLQDVLPGDYLLFPQPTLGTTHVEDAFAQAVGWVASEGYLNRDGYLIQFTFADTNLADIKAVTTCFEKLDAHVTNTPQPQRNRVILSVSNKELHERLSNYVQGILSEKQLTGEVFHWHPDCVRTLLKTYIEGDGHVAPSGRNKGQLRIRSSSHQMLYALSDLIRALGVYTTINWDIPAGHMVSPTNGQTYETSKSGCVTVSSSQAAQISGTTRKHTEGTTRAWTPNLHEGMFLIQVTEREDCFLNEDVFNIEVKKAHHYIANEVLVHNCNKDPKKAVGKILKAFWNPFMHRVEILEDLDNARAPDLVQQIADGEFPAKSMGTRIKFDVCTKCGHRAPTRKQYCDHLKWQMGYLEPDTGIRFGALNPAPRFFDSSWVLRPADRTGYMLKKVAYEVQGFDSSAAGDLVDTLNKAAALARKVATIDKIVRGYPAAVVSTGEEGPLIEKYRNTGLSSVVENTPELSHDDIKTLAPHSLPNILEALSNVGILLTTPEFVQLYLEKMAPGTRVPAEVLQNLTALQGDIFDMLSQRPSMLNTLMSTMEGGQAGPAETAAVQPLMEKRSTIPEYLHRRFEPRELKHENAPMSDVLEIVDPHTGRVYQTTRGAATIANDEIAESKILQLLGSGGLMAGAYKTLRSAPGAYKALSLPLAAGGLLMGNEGLDKYPSYETTSGESIPQLTELVEKRSHVLDLVNSLGMDYGITKTSAARLDKTAQRVRPEHGLFMFLQKHASLGLAFPNLSLDRVVMATEKVASDGIVEETIDLEKAAEIVGTLVWETL